jgi:hypothetical protein
LVSSVDCIVAPVPDRIAAILRDHGARQGAAIYGMRPQWPAREWRSVVLRWDAPVRHEAHAMGNTTCFVAGFATIAAAFALQAGARAEPPAGADHAAIYKAAGAVRRGDRWLLCADDPQASGASIDEFRDINGDGRPEAVVSEGGTFCYGHTGMGFVLLSQGADGGWTRMSGGIGIPEFLKTTGKDGWPDISVGGPGFCFPVERWNGREYVLHRHEYEGKACTPER